MQKKNWSFVFGSAALVLTLAVTGRAEEAEPPSAPTCEEGQTLVYAPTGKIDRQRANACQA